jgi:predicted outer membrane protein/predicted ester cyclase
MKKTPVVVFMTSSQKFAGFNFQRSISIKGWRDFQFTCQAVLNLARSLVPTKFKQGLSTNVYQQCRNILTERHYRRTIIMHALTGTIFLMGLLVLSPTLVFAQGASPAGSESLQSKGTGMNAPPEMPQGTGVPAVGSVQGGFDRAFASRTISAGLAEVELGKLAQKNAENPAIKSLAQRIVQDHAKANDEIMALARREPGASIPSSPQDEDAQAIIHLSKLSGNEFDRQYLQQQIEAHEKSIRLLEQETRGGQNAEMKAWAQKNLPILQDHLQALRSITPTPSEGHIMDTDTNKNVVHAFYDAINRRDFEALGQYCHKDFIFYHQIDTPHHGVEGFIASEKKNFDAFADWQMPIREIIAEDDKVAAYLVFEGTHVGEGLPQSWGSCAD